MIDASLATNLGRPGRDRETISAVRFGDVSRDLAAALRAGIGRPPRSFERWLLEELVIPDGPFRGERFRFERQPITRLWAAEIDSDRWTELVYSGPSQSGKSLIGYVAPMLYHATELGESLVFGVPVEEMAGDKWEADIRPAMEASPRLRRLLPERGPGSAGGSIRDLVKLSNGALLKIATAGGSDQAKAGFTARVVCITEAAKFSTIGSGSVEADPLRQLRARQRSYPRESRRCYIEGTKTLDLELPASLYPISSRSRIVSPCPSCGGWISPERRDLVGWQEARTEVEAAELATWRCPLCEDPISEADRLEALQAARLVHDGQTIDKRGRISGPEPSSSRLWFSYGAWHNAFLSAGDVAVDAWTARQQPENTPAAESAERELAQFVFGDVYTPPAIVEIVDSTPDSVAARRIKLPRGIAPEDAARITVGVDIGERVGHYVALASRSSATAHVVDYGRFDVPLEIGEIEVAIAAGLRDLWEQLSAGFASASGEILPVSLCLVDSGFLPGAVFRFVREAVAAGTSAETLLPCLGRGETQLARTRYNAPKKTGNEIRRIDSARRWHISRVRSAGVSQLTLDADAFKSMAASALAIPLGSPGAISLFSGPATIHRRFSAHVTAERLIVEELPGKPARKRWVRTGANHWLDALVYALCAQYLLGYDPGLEVDAADAPTPEPVEWKY